MSDLVAENFLLKQRLKAAEDRLQEQERGFITVRPNGDIVASLDILARLITATDGIMRAAKGAP
jgi:hypothetical protein